MLKIQPRALHILGKYYTTELHPPVSIFLYLLKNLCKVLCQAFKKKQSMLPVGLLMSVWISHILAIQLATRGEWLPYWSWTCVNQLQSAPGCSVLKLDSRRRLDDASDAEGKSLHPGKNFHSCMTASPGLVVQWPSFCCGCVTLWENPRVSPYL